MAANFTLKCQNMFHTWPQNNTTAVQALSSWVDFWEGRAANIEFACFVQESHEDGSPHIHAVCRMDRRVQIRGADTLDVITGKHGNYTACRSIKKALRYILKENTPVCYPADFDPTAFAGKSKEGAWKVATDMIKAGATVGELMEHNSGFYAQNSTRLRSFMREWKTHHRTLVPYEPAAPIAKIMRIRTWMESAMCQDRPPRSPQLYLSGAPGCGKSWFLSEIRASYRCFEKADDEDWWDEYDDDQFDCIIFDEFTGGDLKLKTLLRILDGHYIKLKQKGQYGGVEKRRNLPVILVSNLTPDEVYTKVAPIRHKAFTSRLLKIAYVEPDFMNFANILNHL